MEFRDLKQQYQILKKDIDQAMIEVATEANFISGKQVTELENQLADFVGVKHCISCANGTDALTLVAMVYDWKEGDAIFVPDFTFFSTGEIVAFEGATPIFVDVEEDTFNISASSLTKAIEIVLSEGKLKPRAVIAVDLFGLPANYPEIEKICSKYNIQLVEDGAQGFGGKIGEKNACSFGDIATTSFFPAKPLGCYGDGGAVFTNDDKVADLLRSLRIHGKGVDKYDNVRIGMNSRLDTLQAAILKVKLNAFSTYENININMVAKKYTDLLGNIVKTPKVPEGFQSSWAQYTITLSDKHERDLLQSFLKDSHIPSMIYYIKPMHQQEAFGDGENSIVSLEKTVKLCDCVLSLPIHPYMSDEDIAKVCNLIKKYICESKGE